MEIDLSGVSPTRTYFLMTQTLIPRPVAWVLSENDAGAFNLAPYSYFTGICSSPPLILISVGKKPDGSPKDTRYNIEQRPDFVVHVAGCQQLEPLNASSETLPPEVSEVEKLGLRTVPFPGSPLPRLADCQIAYHCRLHQLTEIGNGPQTLLFGEIRSIYLADEVVSTDEKGRLKVHADRVDPIARLGAGEYSGIGEITKLQRPG